MQQSKQAEYLQKQTALSSEEKQSLHPQHHNRITRTQRVRAQ
jgi:hypothetical protein